MFPLFAQKLGRNILCPLERAILNHWTREPSNFSPEDGKRSVWRCVCSLLNTPRRTSLGNTSNPCCLDTIVLISFRIIFSVVLCCLDRATVRGSPLQFCWPVNQKRLRYESVLQASGSVNVSLHNSSTIRQVSPKRNKIHIFLPTICLLRVPFCPSISSALIPTQLNSLHGVSQRVFLLKIKKNNCYYRFEVRSYKRL